MDSRKLLRRRELPGAVELDDMPDEDELAEGGDDEEEPEESGDELVESGALPPVEKDGETPKSLLALLDAKQFCWKKTKIN